LRQIGHILALVALPLSNELIAGTPHSVSLRSLLSVSEEWRWAELGVSSGLPSARVRSLVIDRAGVLWVGTDQGLVWYDGYQFVPAVLTGGETQRVDVRQVIGLTSGLVAALVDREVWIGGQAGFTRFAISQVRSSYIQIAPLEDGGVYVLGGQDRYVYSDGTLKRDEAVPWNPKVLATVFPDRDGRPWLSSDGSIFRRIRGEWRKEYGRSGHLTLSWFLENGSVAIGAVRFSDEGAGLIDGQALDLSTLRIVTADRPRAMALHENGEAIAAFESGSVMLRLAGKWRPVPEGFSAGLIRSATAFAFDPSGDLWVGSNRGLTLYRNASQPLRQRMHAAGDERNLVHDLVHRSNGELWMATAGGLEIQRAGGAWESVRSASGVPLRELTGIAEDGSGHIWLTSGASFGGALRFDGAEWRRFGRREGLTDLPIHRVRRDAAGNLWLLATSPLYRGRPAEAGAYRWTGSAFEHWATPPAGDPLGASGVARTPDGAIWFATTGGVWRWQEGRAESYSGNDGLMSNRVFDVAAAPNGDIWVCYQRSGGVTRLRRRSPGVAEVTNFDESGGLPSPEVWSVAVDPKGSVWATTVRGIAVKAGGPWVPAGLGTGVDEAQTWPILVEKDDIWIGSIGQGLLRLGRKDREAGAPRVRFLNAQFGGKLWTVEWRALTQYAALRPNDIPTRFRVDGGEWSEWSRVRSVSFSESESGTHSVEVQAAGPLGDVVERPEFYSFEIPHPFFRRPIVQILAGLALAVLAVAVFLGVRGRVRYTRELEAAKTRAEEGARARSAFLAVMSHEIRTPMNGVLGMTGLMLDTRLDERQRGYMGTIRDSAEGLLGVINDILDFSKIESGTFSINPAPFDLAQTCNQVAALLAPRAAEKGLQLILDYRPLAARELTGDQNRIRQILLNLVGNAIKFTERGFARVVVDSESGGIRICVEDSGIGIDASNIPLLFREFSQVESSAARRFGGTGLGLAISRKLALHMGGDIHVESKPGEGSTFTCELPLVAVRPPAPPEPLEGRCLIVHPDALVRETIAVFCREAGMPADCFAPPDILPREGYRAAFAAESFSSQIAALSAVVIPIAPGDLLSRCKVILDVRNGTPARSDGELPRTAEFSGRVLAVEDNLTNQRVISLMLSKLGCSVSVASNGQAALQFCETERFDLILMDVQMPEMDGLEATTRLRFFNDWRAEVPIVALTANVLEEDRDRCTAAGMSGHLAKPVRQEDLLNVLGRYLTPTSAFPSVSDTRA